MAANESVSGKTRLFTIIIVVGIILGFASLCIHAYLTKEAKLDNDFDHDFTSTGTSSYVNGDYLYLYDETGNTAGNEVGTESYTSTKMTRIIGKDENNRYVSFWYHTRVDQTIFMIDKDGPGPGGVMMMNKVYPEAPPNVPFQFGVHRNSTTIMYLDKSDFSYFTQAYKDNNETAKTGYARSVFTRDLEEEDYQIWIGSIGQAVTAEYKGEESVKDMDGYKYEYSYQLRIPIAFGQQGQPTLFIVMTETTTEVHQQDLGMLMKLDTKIVYTIEGEVGGGPQGPQQVDVKIYEESSSFEMDNEDADDIDTAVSMYSTWSMIRNVLGFIGIVMALVGVIGNKD